MKVVLNGVGPIVRFWMNRELKRRRMMMMMMIMKFSMSSALKILMMKVRRKNLDLVLVDNRADPPVWKIFDFNREQYKREQVKKERRKQKGDAMRLNEVKELHFNAKIESKDLKIKVEKAKKFMEHGYRVKFMVDFKTSMEEEEIRNQNAKLLGAIFPMMDEIAVIEQGPRVEVR
ncbi:hypothetical protein KP509_06G011600 [Ceratopteris richardii]|uniref:Translation initiation factor IF-3 n=1 Tax=Ceratopteris richardii TaxID=49495 RepID=A0A8T2UI25_CERRI|nr:hypothetical protein KP509_06G011600 [Ceratopteris richardii]